MQPLQICIGPTIRIGRESWCLPYAGFLGHTFKFHANLLHDLVHSGALALALALTLALTLTLTLTLTLSLSLTLAPPAPPSCRLFSVETGVESSNNLLSQRCASRTGQGHFSRGKTQAGLLPMLLSME